MVTGIYNQVTRSSLVISRRFKRTRPDDIKGQQLTGTEPNNLISSLVGIFVFPVAKFNECD